MENIFQRDAWFRWRYQIRLHAGKCEHWLAQGEFDKAEEHAPRLLDAASHYEARKYVAVAHKLLAEVHVARGDLVAAERELSHALDQMNTYPVPIVAWKTYALRGRLRAEAGDLAGAREAFAHAAVNIKKSPTAFTTRYCKQRSSIQLPSGKCSRALASDRNRKQKVAAESGRQNRPQIC
ncbi:MAG: hypothetical protein M3458_09020 [Acidobacteriota bacterium]|nr:hypothetical protein [Acidobacteriota bacterium]